MSVPSADAVPGAQRGMSLVEVMVAMAIGIILLLGLGILFVNSTRVFKVSDEFARMQENGAYALNAMGADLRMVGFFGLISSADLQVPVSFVVAGDCGTDWAIDFAQPLSALHDLDASQANTELNCIQVANFIPSTTNRKSFILVLRGATGTPVLPAELTVGNAPGSLYVQADPGGGILFKGDQYAGLAAPFKRTTYPRPYVSGAPPVDAPIYLYQARAYYLRPCSRPTGAGAACLASDDGNEPIPTLVRQELAGTAAGTTAMTEVAVAEGIEAIRVLYGVDTDDLAPIPDGVPNAYTEVPDDTQLARVVTARIAVLVRSPQPTNGYDDASRRYDLDGDGIAELNCTADALPCNYHRHVFTQTFQLRNVAQRLASP